MSQLLTTADPGLTAPEPPDPQLVKATQVGQVLHEQFSSPEIMDEGLKPRAYGASGDQAARDYAMTASTAYSKKLQQLAPDISEDSHHALLQNFRHSLTERTRAYQLQKLIDESKGAGQRDTAEYWGRRIPFLGGIGDAAYHLRLSEAISNYDAGRADGTDHAVIAHSIAERSADEDRSVWGKALDIATQVPTGAAEWVLSGGTAAASQTASVMRGLAQRAVGTVVKQAPFLPLRAGEQTISRMTPTATMTPQGLRTEAGESFGPALAKSIGADAIERGVFGAVDPFHVKAGETYASKVISSLAGTGKLFAAGEATQDLQNLVKASPQGGPVQRWAFAKTDEEREHAIKDMLAEGIGFGLFETGMHFSMGRAGKTVDEKQAVQSGVLEAIKAVAEKEHTKAYPDEAAPGTEDALPVTPEAAPSPPGVQEGKKAPEEAPKQPGTTGLASIGGAGKAMVENLYGGLYESLQKGKTKFAGIEDPVLKRAKAAYDQGLLKSPEDLQKLVNADYDPRKAGLTQPEAKPATPRIPPEDVNAVFGLNQQGEVLPPEGQREPQRGIAGPVEQRGMSPEQRAAQQQEIQKQAAALIAKKVPGSEIDHPKLRVEVEHAIDQATQAPVTAEAPQAAPVEASQEPASSEAPASSGGEGGQELSRQVPPAQGQYGSNVPAWRWKSGREQGGRVPGNEADAHPPAPAAAGGDRAGGAAGPESASATEPAAGAGGVLVKSEKDPDLGYAKYHDLTVNSETKGTMTIGEPSASGSDVEGARQQFPQAIRPGQTVARITGIELQPDVQGKGNGQKLYLGAMIHNGADWFYNSQTYPGATNALKALAKKGYVEVLWDKEPGWDEKGGYHLVRVTDAGKQAFGEKPAPGAGTVLKKPSLMDKLRQKKQDAATVGQKPREPGKVHAFEEPKPTEPEVKAPLTPEEKADLLKSKPEDALRDAVNLGDKRAWDAHAERAGLTAQQKFVMEERFQGTKQTDMVLDPRLIELNGGKKVTDTTIKNWIKGYTLRGKQMPGALQKLGMPRDFFETGAWADEKANSIAATMERQAELTEQEEAGTGKAEEEAGSQAASFGELNQFDEGVRRRVVKDSQNAHGKALDEINDLQKELFAKDKDGNRRVTPERAREIRAEIDRRYRTLEGQAPEEEGVLGSPGEGPATGETQAPEDLTAEGMGAAGGGSQVPLPSGARQVGAPQLPPEVAKAALPSKPWYQKAADWLKSFAQQTYPSLTRLSKEAGEKLAAASNAPNAAKAAWNYFSNQLKVGGIALKDMSTEESRYVGAVWLERRFRTYRQRLINDAAALDRQAADATQTPDREERNKLRQQAQKVLDQAKEIGTLVGSEGSPLKTEADFTQGRDNLWSFWEAIKQEWTPEVEANYRGLKGLEPDEEIGARSQIPQLPLNAIALREGEEVPQGAVRVGGRQSLSNIRLKQPGFMRAAELNGEAYDLDVRNMMKRTLDLGIPAARRAEFVRSGIENGVIQKVEGGEKPKDGWKALELKPAAGLEGLSKPAAEDVEGMTGQEAYLAGQQAKNARYYAHPDAFSEIIQGLGIGERPGQSIISGMSAVFNKINMLALQSPVEIATHIANHITSLFRPGMGVSALKNAVSDGWQIYKGNPDQLKAVWDLAKISASFGHESRPGLFGEKGDAWLKAHGVKFGDPTARVQEFTSKFIDTMQKGFRLQLGKAYDRMVESGSLKDAGDTGKRDFINQALGNYNAQSNNRVIQFLKDTGLQPFAQAASTFSVQGVKTMWGGAVNAKSAQGKLIQNHAIAMAKLLPVMAVGPVLNAIIWGNPFPQGVPAFAAKTGEDNDKVNYFDPVAFTGLRRGAKATGVSAVVEGLREGKSSGQIADSAVRGAVGAGEHVLAGPPVQFLHTAITGENALGHKVTPSISTATTPQGVINARAKGMLPQGSSQSFENVKAALLGVNPLLGTFTEADRPKTPRTMVENLMRSAGPFGTKERSLPKHKALYAK